MIHFKITHIVVLFLVLIYFHFFPTRLQLFHFIISSLKSGRSSLLLDLIVGLLYQVISLQVYKVQETLYSFYQTPVYFPMTLTFLSSSHLNLILVTVSLIRIT